MKKPVRCPLCESEMGKVDSPKDAWYCDECNTYVDTAGKVLEINEEGDKTQIATVKDADKPIPEDKPKTYDAYFTSKDKRRLMGIVETEHLQGALVMTNRLGKEIILNWANVNCVEEV